MSVIFEQTAEVERTVSPNKYQEIHQNYGETSQFFSQQVGEKGTSEIQEKPQKYEYDPSISKTMN